MKKFLLGLVLSLPILCPLFGHAQATNGFHRTAVALARAFQGVTAQVVPNAKVAVTATATGSAAAIYSDPALTSQIIPSVVTADNSGNYGYYIPLGYCVTETITSPGQGAQVITNICNNNSGAGTSIQTNGVNNSSQTNLNFTDTPGVSWSNPSGGVESVAVIVGNGITSFVQPPISGQYVIVYPTAVATNNSNNLTAEGDATSGTITGVPWTSFPGSNASVTWSAPALPSYVLAANVTAVYAFAVSENGSVPNPPSGHTPSIPEIISFQATATGASTALLTPSAYAVTGTWQLQQSTAQLTSLTGANFSSAVTEITEGVGADFGGATYTNIPLVGYFVYYTGTAPPANDSVQIVSPLQYNPSLNTLSISPQAQFPGTALVPTTVQGLPKASASDGWIVPVTDGASATDCITGGGSTYVQCQSSGTVWAAYSPSGGMVYPAAGIAKSTGSAWGTSYGAQGTDTNLLTAGTVSGTGATLCTDANGGATTSGCSSGSGLTSLNSLTGPALNLTSSDSSVTITPSGTSIDLSATGGGGSGVQYNPSTTNYVFLSYSGLYDDTGALSSPVTVSNFSCSTGTCTVTTATDHGLVAGDFVDVSSMTGFGATSKDPYYGSFPVATAPTTTTLTFAYSGSATTGSGGTIADADYWGIYQAANQPFIKGHGTVLGHFSTIANAAANFSTLFAPLCALTPGPNYLIIEGGQNDLLAGTSVATIEADLQSIWNQAHTAGCQVLQGSITDFNPGGSPLASVWPSLAAVNVWIPSQAKSFSNASGGEYFDKFIDYASYLNNIFPSGTVTLGATSAGAYNFAQRTNEAFSSQSSSANGPMPLWGPNNNGKDIVFYNGLYGVTTWIDKNNNYWMQQGCCGTNGDYLGLFNNYTINGATMEISAAGSSNPLVFGYYAGIASHNWANNNAFAFGFHYASSGSTSNYMSITPWGAGDSFRIFADGGVQLPNVATSANTSPLCPNGTNGELTTAGCASGGLSGMTASQVPIAATATTVTSSKALAGSGAGITTGPTTSTANDCVAFADTSGTIKDISCGSGGTVTTTGSPSSGDIAAFSGSTSITTATATQINTLIATLTNCNIATYLYSPQSGTCLAPSAGSSPIGVGFILNSGTVATPASVYLTAPNTGTITTCNFTTTTSDSGTALTMNLILHGTSIFSGSSQTIAAATAAKTISSLTLTGSISVTAGYLWELDISSGTTNWTGALQCQ